jgi:hypothetical protein
MSDLSTGRLCTRKERTVHLINPSIISFESDSLVVCWSDSLMVCWSVGLLVYNICCEVCKTFNLVHYNLPFTSLHKMYSANPSLLSYN